MGKPEAAYLLIGALAILTQVLRGLQAGVAVVLQETSELQKIVALYEVGLACPVSAVISQGVPETVAWIPSTSRGCEILRIRVLPSAQVVDSFTRPLHSK
jgi:hypothetical protein